MKSKSPKEPNVRIHHVICGTSGSLHFPTTELKQEYEQAEEKLLVAMYKKIRDKYGIWASNQDKFVLTKDQFNNWDNPFMEQLYAKYYD